MRVSNGSDRFGSGQEGRDERVHRFDPLRLLVGEVGFFADVLAEVVEFPTMGSVLAAVEEADEFPVFLGDGDGGRQPVGHAGSVREIGEERLAFQLAALEGGEDADAVEFLAGGSGKREAFFP